MKTLSANSVGVGRFVIGPQNGLYQIIKNDKGEVGRLILNDTNGTLRNLPALGREGFIAVADPNKLTNMELVGLFGWNYPGYRVAESYSDVAGLINQI